MMNCPNCGLYVDTATTSRCPRCGQPLAGSAPANPGRYGWAANPFSDSPTMLSGGPTPPGASSPQDNYGFGYPGQGAPPAAPGTWSGTPSSTPGMWSGTPPGAPSAWPDTPPGAPGSWSGMPSGYPPPGYQPPPPGGFSPLPPTPPRKSRTGLVIGIALVVVVVLLGGLGAVFALGGHHNQGQTGGNATATSPVTTPSATPTPTQTILFQDPLTSNANGWANDNNCFFQNNAYHIKNGYVCYAPTGIVDDAAISVQAQQLSGSNLYPYGIVFRRVSTGNWYEFDIDSNGKWVFFKVVNGTADKLVDYTPNAVIKKGLNTTNTLMVKAKGTHFTFFVNGTQVGQSDDTTFSSGHSGLDAGSTVEAAFNNFLMTTVS